MQTASISAFETVARVPWPRYAAKTSSSGDVGPANCFYIGFRNFCVARFGHASKPLKPSKPSKSFKALNPPLQLSKAPQPRPRPSSASTAKTNPSGDVGPAATLAAPLTCDRCSLDLSLPSFAAVSAHCQKGCKTAGDAGPANCFYIGFWNCCVARFSHALDALKALKQLKPSKPLQAKNPPLQLSKAPQPRLRSSSASTAKTNPSGDVGPAAKTSLALAAVRRQDKRERRRKPCKLLLFRLSELLRGCPGCGVLPKPARGTCWPRLKSLKTIKTLKTLKTLKPSAAPSCKLLL